MSDDQKCQMMRYWDVWLRDDLSVWEITPAELEPDRLNQFMRTLACPANRLGRRGWVQAPDAADAIRQARACIEHAQRRRHALAGWAVTP